MSPSGPAEVLARRQAIVRAAFALLIGCFLLSNLMSLLEIVGVRSRNRLLMDNMLASIELISRIAHAVDRKRLLVDEHIFESSAADMAKLEKQLDAVDADYDAARHAYEPIATLTHEHEAWVKVEAAIAAIQRPTEHALELSRQNRDDEARAVMGAVQARFDDIDQTLDSLIQINRDEGERTVAMARERQARAILLLGVITIGGTTLALGIALWVSRVLRRRDDQVRQATVRLEAQNHELDAFAGRVAHDLRGPLTTISLSAATIAEGAPKEDRALAILQRGISRMEALIQDLLALSRVDAQPTGAIAQTASVMKAVEDDLATAISSVNGVLHLDVEPAGVTCSDGLLRQVLWNLGENAVKYRRSDHRLQLSILGRDAGRRYELRISDNGTGMSADDVRHAFDPFFRSTGVRAIPGTGLGLSIVKRIIETSGGSVSIDSEPGRGTTFVIELPLAQAPG